MAIDPSALLGSRQVAGARVINGIWRSLRPGTRGDRAGGLPRCYGKARWLGLEALVPSAHLQGGAARWRSQRRSGDLLPLDSQDQAVTAHEPEGGPAATNITNRIGATAALGGVTIRRRPRSGRGRLSACGAAGIALLSAGVLAACGGGAQASSPSKVMSGALAYANCMRSHGVPDFPDPNSQGEFQLRPSVRVENGGPTPVGDLIPSSPAFQAAERTCGPFGSAGRQVTAAQEEQAFQKALKAAACMRANGVPNYPDPKLIDGSIDQEFNGKFNPDSPGFQRAAGKCAKPGVVLAGTLPPG